MNKSKFIIVQDKPTSEKLKTVGFQLISEANDLCVFLNVPPQNFSFNEVDMIKVGFTNTLSI